MSETKLISLKEAETLFAILNLNNKNCEESFNNLNSISEKYNLKITMLLINSGKSPIPGWCLKDNIRVINKKVDFNAFGMLRNEDALNDIFNEKYDLLFAISNDCFPIVDRISKRVCAMFKVGKEFSRHNPYDLSIKFTSENQPVELAMEFASKLEDLAGNK